MTSILISMLKSAWPYAVAASFGFSAAWWLQGVRIERLEAQHLTYAAEVEANALKAKAAALMQEKQWIKEKEDAQKRADEREAKLRGDLSAAVSAAGGLRHTVAALRSRMSSATPAAVTETADTLAELFEQCVGDYRAMAEAADRHALDAATLSEAWPK